MFFLQAKPNLDLPPKVCEVPMLIMTLLVLGIGFLQDIMNLLLDVLDALNKFVYPINLNLSMGGLFLCNCNGESYASMGANG
jgi:hypothetical protein